MEQTDGRDMTAWPGLIERPPRGASDWPEGVTAVLVHGTMDRGAGMAHVARVLRDAPTLRYDRRGYGRASGLGTGSLVRHSDDLVEIVGTRPAVLFGHSFGGLVVLAVAATGRLDVRAVVTWEVPTPWIPGWSGWRPDPDRSGPAGADPGDVAERFMRSAVGTKQWEALPERTRQARRAEGPALVADMDPTLAVGVPFDPQRISVPCVFGAGDVSVAPYIDGAEWLSSRVADGRVRVLAGAPHGAPMSRPADVADLIRDAARRGTDAGRGARSVPGGDDAVTR